KTAVNPSSDPWTLTRGGCHFGPLLPYSRPSVARPQGLPWRRNPLSQFARASAAIRRASARFRPVQEMTQMPKMKTKSGAKKRFKVTATGKVLAAHAGKRHGMIKRTNKQIRQHRGVRTMFKTDGDNVRKYFLPNG